MIAVLALAVLVTLLVCIVAAILIDRPEARHAARRRRPLRLAWLRLLAFTADLIAAHRKANGLSDEDAVTVEWAESLHGRRQLGPPAPARRPRLLAAAQVRCAAIIRALPVEQLPWLQHGQGYRDTTGTFAKITREEP